MLGKLAIALPKAKIDDAEADARLEIYWSALRDIPLPDLRQAYDRLLKTSRFFPTIEEIRAAAHPSMAMRSYKRMRMQMLITRHDREWQPDGEPLTDAERREMQKIIPGRSEERRVGKGVSVRVDLGGRRTHKKKKEQIRHLINHNQKHKHSH